MRALKITSSRSGGIGIDLSRVSTYMTVVAPQTGVTLSNGSEVFGSVVGKTLALSGDSSVHFDTH